MKPSFTIYALAGTPGTGDPSEARIRQSLYPKSPIQWDSEKMAFLEIVGPLEFSDYIDIREKVDRIRENKRFSQVLLYMNSPGGVAAGAPETAAAINRLNLEKPVLCVAEGYCASAGYMLASQCSELIVSPTCTVGSVGVISVLVDSTEMFKRLGLRVIPVATGPDKTVGLEGVPIDDAAVATMLELVNQLQRQFILTLKESPFLNSDKIVAMASRAGVWLGEEAVKNGFATGLGTFEEVRRRVDRQQADAARAEIETLKGEEAAGKYCDLVAELAGGSFYRASREHHVAIATQFPKLAAAAQREDPEIVEAMS